MAKTKMKTMADTYCLSCCERQYVDKKVITCPNGHDGVEGMSKGEYKHRKELKQTNSVCKHIYIQLGNDEDEDVETFYRILGAQGQFTLRQYKRSQRSDKQGNEEDFDKVHTSYHASLHWICRKIMTLELTDQEAITVEQLLEVVKSVEEKIDSLSETIFLLSEDTDDE